MLEVSDSTRRYLERMDDDQVRSARKMFVKVQRQRRASTLELKSGGSPSKVSARRKGFCIRVSICSVGC